MALSKNQKVKIQEVLKSNLLHKLSTYKPETFHMPFHFRLLGKDRMALYSFIQSLNTTFGKSIFEPVAEILSKDKFAVSKKQYFVGDNISEYAQHEIQTIINELTNGGSPNKKEEVERIRRVCQAGHVVKLKTVRVDLFLESEDRTVHLFDLKTVKPNISNFKDYKRTLLEWIGIYLFQYPNASVNSYIAIPYNPYEPAPYERWTLKGMLDIENELKVASEFWDFLGGEGAYYDLLDCFEKVGVELRPVIEKYFSKYK